MNIIPSSAPTQTGTDTGSSQQNLSSSLRPSSELRVSFDMNQSSTSSSSTSSSSRRPLLKKTSRDESTETSPVSFMSVMEQSYQLAMAKLQPGATFSSEAEKKAYLSWLTTAAECSTEHGSSASARLGTLHERGTHVRQSPKKALRYYQKAATGERPVDTRLSQARLKLQSSSDAAKREGITLLHGLAKLPQETAALLESLRNVNPSAIQDKPTMATVSYLLAKHYVANEEICDRLSYIGAQLGERACRVRIRQVEQQLRQNLQRELRLTAGSVSLLPTELVQLAVRAERLGLKRLADEVRFTEASRKHAVAAQKAAHALQSYQIYKMNPDAADTTVKLAREALGIDPKQPVASWVMAAMHLRGAGGLSPHHKLRISVYINQAQAASQLGDPRKEAEPTGEDDSSSSSSSSTTMPDDYSPWFPTF